MILRNVKKSTLVDKLIEWILLDRFILEGTNVRIVAISFALEARDSLVLKVVLRITGKQESKLFFRYLVFLTVSAFVSNLTTPMTSYFIHLLQPRLMHLVLMRRSQSVLIRPVLVVRKVGNDLQSGIIIGNHVFYMLFITIRTFRTKSIHVILTNLPDFVIKLT